MFHRQTDLPLGPPKTYSHSSSTTYADVHHDARPPIIQGPGAKPGTVPTDLEQATGSERYKILSRMERQEPFDNKHLQVPHMGTLANPVKVFSLVRDDLLNPILSRQTLH